MNYDFAPLFRTAIGFDRLARAMDNATRNPGGTAYPPYNIEKTGEESYALTMAVAGFGPGDIEVTTQDNTLVVSGRVNEPANGSEILYRGIAARAFERRFALAHHVEVTQASLANGLLTVSVRRIVPEAAKPRRIEITTPEAAQAQVIATNSNAERGAIVAAASETDHASSPGVIH